jgi:hypothetical protein
MIHDVLSIVRMRAFQSERYIPTVVHIAHDVVVDKFQKATLEGTETTTTVRYVTS